MTPQDELRARLNPHRQSLTDVMADGFYIDPGWLKLLAPRGAGTWSRRTCWLVLAGCGAGIGVLVWAGGRR